MPPKKGKPQQYNNLKNFGIFGGIAAFVAIVVSSYTILTSSSSKDKQGQAKKFTDDFLAQNWNRSLTFQEKEMLKPQLPNADFSKIKYLGLGYTKPTVENCKSYDCTDMFAHTIEVYHKSNTTLETKIKTNDLSILESTYDKCTSKYYICGMRDEKTKQIFPFVAATYNCVGHALGIGKWLDNREITTYAKKMLYPIAIQSFINDKAKTFTNSHPSNWGHFIDNIKCVPSLLDPLPKEYIAFYFKDKQCTHVSLYTNKFGNHKMENHVWTSKLGHFGTIAHSSLKDLTGETYGFDYDHYCIIN